MKKVFCLVMAALTLNLTMFAGVPLTRGTQVPVRLTTDANSKTGDTPTAIVEQDVATRDGKVLIAKGTPVQLEIEAQKARGCGRPGSITVKCVSTQSVDGQRIALEGTKSTEGANKKGSTIGLGVGLGCFVWPCLFILCKKGGEATIPANTLLTNVSVAWEYSIEK